MSQLQNQELLQSYLELHSYLELPESIFPELVSSGRPCPETRQTTSLTGTEGIQGVGTRGRPKLGLVTRSRTGLHSLSPTTTPAATLATTLAPTMCMRPVTSSAIVTGVSSFVSSENAFCLVIYNEHRALLERMTKFQLAANSYSCTVMVANFSFFQINAFFPRPFQTPLIKLCGHFT